MIGSQLVGSVGTSEADRDQRVLMKCHAKIQNNHGAYNNVKEIEKD